MVIHSTEVRLREDGQLIFIERFGYLDLPIWFQHILSGRKDIHSLSWLGYAEGCPGISKWSIISCGNMPVEGHRPFAGS